MMGSSQKPAGLTLCHVGGTVQKLPLVSIVMLSYNRPQYISEVLESIEAQSYTALEVIVIDNQSESSGEIANIVSRHPTVRLILSQENLGFTGGMNLGIEMAGGEYIYLTEDDIVLERDCIRNLVEYASAHPGAGLLSGLMYNKREGTIRCAGGYVSLGTAFGMEILGHGQPDRGQFQNPMDVGFIPGAMMFATRGLWKKLGGFRTDFFMYFEDTELCLRVLRQGYTITVVPSAKVHHFEPAEKSSESVTFHAMKNFIVLYILHASWPVLAWFLFRKVLVELIRLSLTDTNRARLLWRACRVTFAVAGELLRQRRSVRRTAEMVTAREA